MIHGDGSCPNRALIDLIWKNDGEGHTNVSLTTKIDRSRIVLFPAVSSKPGNSCESVQDFFFILESLTDGFSVNETYSHLLLFAFLPYRDNWSLP